MSTKTLLAASASMALLCTGAASADALTIVGWGGSLGEAQKQAIENPFAKETGTTINSVSYNGGLAEVKIQVQTDAVSWDIVDAEMTDAVLGCDEGILEEISASDLAPGAGGQTPEADFIADAITECGVASYVWSNVVAFDTSKFPQGGPQTIADFFDTTAFPGKRGLRKNPRANLEWALMADGVPVDEIYAALETDEGVARAFAKLDTIKSDVIWWDAGAQPPQLLADGEVAMTSAYNGRLYNAIVKEGQPFEIIWGGQVWDYGVYVIPANSPNKAKAMEFLRFATAPEQLAELTKYISYGPARKSALDLVSAETQAQLPTSDQNFKGSLRQSADFWGEYGDELSERFNAWLLVK